MATLTVQDPLEHRYPIPELFPQDIWWGFRPVARRIDNTDGFNYGQQLGTYVRDGRLRGFYLPGAEKFPSLGGMVWGCAWLWPGNFSGPLHNAPYYWFPRIVLIEVEAWKGDLVRCEGRPFGPYFRCSDLDPFLVPIIVNGDVAALGAFADCLEERDDPRAGVVGALFRTVQRRIERGFPRPWGKEDETTLTRFFAEGNADAA